MINYRPLTRPVIATLFFSTPAVLKPICCPHYGLKFFSGVFVFVLKSRLKLQKWNGMYLSSVQFISVALNTSLLCGLIMFIRWPILHVNCSAVLVRNALVISFQFVSKSFIFVRLVDNFIYVFILLPGVCSS